MSPRFMGWSAIAIVSGSLLLLSSGCVDTADGSYEPNVNVGIGLDYYDQFGYDYGLCRGALPRWRPQTETRRRQSGPRWPRVPAGATFTWNAVDPVGAAHRWPPRALIIRTHPE